MRRRLRKVTCGKCNGSYSKQRQRRTYSALHNTVIIIIQMALSAQEPAINFTWLYQLFFLLGRYFHVSCNRKTAPYSYEYRNKTIKKNVILMYSDRKTEQTMTSFFAGIKRSIARLKTLVGNTYWFWQQSTL